MYIMGSSGNIQVPRMFFSNQDRTSGNDLLMSKDPNSCLLTSVALKFIPTSFSFLEPVVVRPFISFGLKCKKENK